MHVCSSFLFPLLTEDAQERVGKVLYAEMEKLAQKYPEYVMNLRGKDQG